MKVKNRKCIRKISFRSLWAQRKRNIIAVAAIALTALMFTSLFTVAMSINSSYEMYTFREIGGYAHGTFKDLTASQIEAISAHPKIKASGQRTSIGFVTEGEFAKIPAEVSYMDDNYAKWGFAQPTEGHLPKKENEIAMDTKALEKLGVKPQMGAQVELTYTMGDQNQNGNLKTDTFVLSGWWEYDEISPVHFINVSKDYVQKVQEYAYSQGMESFRTDLNVMLYSALDIRGQMEQVDLDLGYSWEGFDGENVARIGVNWGYTTSQLNENIDFQTVAAITAFIILVVFTGYLIIYNIFQISVIGDIRFYGLLKTIGVTPRQLKRIIRWQALILCTAGIPVGLVLGYGVGALLTPIVLKNTTFGAQYVFLSFSPIIFIASALFALFTVLISCSRPGKIAAKVSPVEATKYSENVKINKKQRAVRGAKIYQMAFANLGRNKIKTALVIVSLSLSVVLLNLLVIFTTGFDMEKYLEDKICADFIVSSTDYFRSSINAEGCISQDKISEIKENTNQSFSGCGYTLSNVNINSWVSYQEWEDTMLKYGSSQEMIESAAQNLTVRDNLVGVSSLIEGLDKSLFDKITVVDGDISLLFNDEENYIALEVNTDDYGNIIQQNYPPIGSKYTVTYIQNAYYIDSRTGEKSNENTPAEFLKYFIEESKDVEYTICAYVTVPFSMGYRYSLIGNDFVLPVEKLEKDGGEKADVLFFLFDTPDLQSEEEAESYLSKLTSDNISNLMYASKAVVRQEFNSFKSMFLILGGVICAVIGVIGILNFFNAVMTGIISRAREFAVLQAVGMTNRQLKNMLVYEGVFYALGASLAAFLISVLCTPVISGLFEKIFWFFTPKITFVPMIIAVAVFVFLGWLIPYVMYGQTSKYSVVERLQKTD